MSAYVNRRHFLKATSSWVAAWHASLISNACAVDPEKTNPRLLHLKLQATKLDQLRHFYHRILGLPVIADTSKGFTLKTGPSSIDFAPAPDKSEPFYHFAFNIPENQFAEAKAWLAKRTPLLRDTNTGKDEVFFASWNSHAVYFRDPAGNIGELIARHPLKNGSKTTFSEHSLLCVSEIGLVTNDVKSLSDELANKLAWNKSGTGITFVGDGMGYLIVAPKGRPWLPDRIQKAAVAPVEVTVNQAIPEPLKWDKQPYSVNGNTAVNG